MVKIKTDGVFLLFIVCLTILLITSMFRENKLGTDKDKILESDAERVLSIFNGVSCDIEERVEYLLSENYDDIKDSLDVNSDFCIYFKDNAGEIIQIKEGVNGIGSPDISISGVPCK